MTAHLPHPTRVIRLGNGGLPFEDWSSVGGLNDKGRVERFEPFPEDERGEWETIHGRPGCEAKCRGRLVGDETRGVEAGRGGGFGVRDQREDFRQMPGNERGPRADKPHPAAIHLQDGDAPEVHDGSPIPRDVRQPGVASYVRRLCRCRMASTSASRS